MKNFFNNTTKLERIALLTCAVSLLFVSCAVSLLFVSCSSGVDAEGIIVGDSTEVDTLIIDSLVIDTTSVEVLDSVK